MESRSTYYIIQNVQRLKLYSLHYSINKYALFKNDLICIIPESAESLPCVVDEFLVLFSCCIYIKSHNC